jgi:hypothetical protein
VKPSGVRRSRGGIDLPQCVTGVSALEGVITHVGPDCEDKRTKVNARISFAPYSKYVVPAFEGEYKDHLIINEEDILMYWEEVKNAKD